MADKHTVTVFASSMHPKDWGRALADAMSELSALLDGDQAPNERLIGQDLHLSIRAGDGGVDITLSWERAPRDGRPPGPQASP